MEEPVMTSDTAFQAIVPYYGGKRTAGPAIAEQCGSHRSYWDRWPRSARSRRCGMKP